LPLCSNAILSPYFLGFNLDATHLIVSISSLVFAIASVVSPQFSAFSNTKSGL